jgi:IS5 family transposase
LADEALEDALYDSQALRNFAGIDLSVESVPDATTLLQFRHLLEAHDLTKGILQEVTGHLGERQLFLKEGTLVDATIIAAPPSTKNASQARDPQMHQTKKGNQWHFGMKAHIGTDPQGVVHTVVGTAANVADVACAHRVLHGEETTGHGDAGYLGVEKRPEVLEQCPKVTWHIAAKRSRVKALPEGPLKALTQEFEKLKAQVRAKVEHPFHVVKNLFGFRKVRYRGLAKNTAQLHTLFALANLVLCKGRLLAGVGA